MSSAIDGSSATTTCCTACGGRLNCNWQVCPWCAQPVVDDAGVVAVRHGELLPAERHLPQRDSGAPLVSPHALPAGDSSWQSLRHALDNRLVVLALLAVAGPLGLPAVWLNRRFSRTTKIVLSLLFFAVTVVLPIVATWYACETLLRPLADAFPPVPVK